MIQRTVHQRRELTKGESEHLPIKHSHGRLGLCIENEPCVVSLPTGTMRGQYISAMQREARSWISSRRITESASRSMSGRRPG